MAKRAGVDGGPVKPVPVWIRCNMCEDWWCVRHQLHVYDCDCPGLEEFLETEGRDPYTGEQVDFPKAEAPVLGAGRAVAKGRGGGAGVRPRRRPPESGTQ